MKTYKVHIYREMCLFVPGIVARTAEEATTLAAEKPSGMAEALEDCAGENLAALAGVVDSADCSASSRSLQCATDRKNAGRQD